MKEFFGKTDGTERNFDNCGLIYSLFIFKENDERLFLLLYNSKRELKVYQSLGLDPRYCDEFEESLVDIINEIDSNEA